MLVRPKKSQWIGTQQESGLEMRNLAYSRSFVNLHGYAMTADCHMKRILKNNSEAKYSWQYAGQEVLICTYCGKNPYCSSHIVTPFMDMPEWGTRSSVTRTRLENLSSVMVTHSSVLSTSPDTKARVWHLRWT